MGSLSKMLGMLPGMGELRDQLDNFDEREIDRIEAIIQSMTPAERASREDPQRLAPAAHRPRLRAPRSATSTSWSTGSSRRAR